MIFSFSLNYIRVIRQLSLYAYKLHCIYSTGGSTWIWICSQSCGFLFHIWVSHNSLSSRPSLVYDHFPTFPKGKCEYNMSYIHVCAWLSLRNIYRMSTYVLRNCHHHKEESRLISRFSVSYDDLLCALNELNTLI